MRALVDLLRANGHSVVYMEGHGGALTRLFLGIRSAFGRYDLFFTQKFNPVTFPAILVARVRRKKVWVDWDDLDTDLQKRWWARWLTAICEQIGPYFCQGVTTHSEILRSKATKSGRSAMLVPQGFDEKLFEWKLDKRTKLRDRLGLSSDSILIGHLCTFTHGGTLDLSVILAAWERIHHPRIHYLLVGGGPDEEIIREEISRRGLSERTFISGLIPHEEVADWLSAIDLAVIFMRDTPGNRARVSFKLIEYLAMNLPVVGQVVGETKRQLGNHLIEATEATLSSQLEKAAFHLPASPTLAAVLPYRWSENSGNLERHVASILQGEKSCL